MFSLPFKKWDAHRVYLINAGAQEGLFMMIFTALGIYLITVAQFDPLQLVLTGTALEVTIFIFEVPTGIVADVYSRRLSVIIGVVITGTAFILAGLTPIFWVILLSQTMWGLGNTFTSGATNAWLVDEVGEQNAGPIFLQAARIATLSAAAGTLAAVGIGTFGIQLPIVLGGTLFIALGIWLIAVMGETGFNPNPRENRNPWQHMRHTFMQGARSIRGRPILIALMLVTIIVGASSEGIDRLWAAHVVRDIGFPTLFNLQPVHWLGGFDFVRWLFVAGVVRLVERWLNTRSQRRLALTLIALTTLRIGLIVVFTLVGSYAEAMLITLLMSTTRVLREPLTETWLNQQIDSKVRATVLSMNGQANALGEFAVGPLFGWIGLVGSLRMALAAAGLALLPTLLLYARTLRHSDKLAPEEVIAAAEP